MARANARTLGLLNRWPLVMNEDVWRFNQILGAGVRMPQGSVAQAYVQYEREYIADSLQTAIAQTADALGYPPAPMWIDHEYIVLDPDYHWTAQQLVTKFGHVIEFGQRATSLISADAPLTFSDANGDQVDDTVTITVTTSISPDEIGVFYRVADGADAAAHEWWEIEGLTKTASGGTVTITGHKALFVHPLNVWAHEYTSDDWNVKYTGDTQDPASFVSAVDVYRVYADATNAVQLISSARDTDTPTTNVTATLLDADYGLFKLFVGDSQTDPDAYPHAVKVSYRAGLPLTNGRIQPRLETGLIRYANTIQAQPPALNDRANAMWMEDRKVSDLLTRADANSAQPFGITVGGHHLWQIVRSMRMSLKARG